MTFIFMLTVKVLNLFYLKRDVNTFVNEHFN
jgi:hypothetical protein